MIIMEKGLQNIKMESDSTRAFHLILQRTGTSLFHIYRGSNQCADHLARLHAEQEEDLVIVESPPILLREFMIMIMIRDSLSSY
ncbi:hypothetical protein RHMOL_Rhmol11G0140500 [Rhododendron molle]|nr:hypothetical protein RHMOL_Rhmol11G0140500 [Rhododendron molle]